VTLGPIRLSLLQVFIRRREYLKGVLPEPGAGAPRMAGFARWPHINCDLGPLGLIEGVYSAVSNRIIGELVLLGVGRA